MKTKIVLGLIILIAALFRFVALDKIPVSPYWDEVAIGYNAYSIAHTGRDEYGKLFPLLFRSYDDYKMPVHIYLTAIPVLLFGLSVFSVRFISALLGTASVLIVFFLVKELFDLVKYNKKSYHKVIAGLAALLLAISPWHIAFSRASFEANTGLFFVLLALVLFLKGVREFKYLLVSFGIFAVSVYCYRSLLIFVPLFLCVSLFVFSRELLTKNARKYTLFGVVLFIILAAPIYLAVFNGQGAVRAQEVSVSSEIQQRIEKSTKFIADSPPSVLGKITLNRRYIAARTVYENFLSHFSVSFLFFDGDVNGRHGSRHMGMLYLWEIVSIAAGMFYLLRMSPRVLLWLFAWLALAAIPASLSLPVPHALRDLTAVPVYAILSAAGIVGLGAFIKKRKYIYVGIITLVIGFFSLQFIYLYFFVTPKETAADWGDGYPQLVQYVTTHESEYQKVLITGANWEPYMYFLFYTSYNPRDFQKQENSTHFGKYEFAGTSWDKNKNSITIDQWNLQKYSSENTLLAFSRGEYSNKKDEVQYINTIRDMNGKEVFILAKLKR
jgi:4-amino-4-deoxy-L-arabinose transferase-like glycosyltransferase